MIKDIIANNEEVSPNDREMAVLRENFPSCFTDDGSFDIERFKEFLSDKVAVTHEGYELKFLGKNYARLLAAEDTTTVISPDVEHNSRPENENSENIYISADNLDALKHLLKSYAGSIKCIYIDPPYNTGSDGFVYNDNFNFTADELSRRLSIDFEQAERILDLTKRGSASHSAWLMFMYPRLLLARDLLDKDGVIFISIDDNECHNLKLLCDEIFMENNLVTELVWEKKKKGSYLASSITNIKEYILVYAKSKDAFTGLIGEINSEEETYPCVNASNGRDLRHIPAGIKSKYKEKSFILKKGEIISDTTMNLVLHSDLVIKNGVLAQDLDIEGNWRYGQDAMTEYAKKGELYITRDLYLRRIVKEPRYKGLKDLLLRVGRADDEDSKECICDAGYSYDFDENNLQISGWGSNEDADEEQRLLFGEQSLMNYPKPVLLIMKLISSLHKEKMTVVDFFAGSATTAEAVMRLSLKHKYNYMCIQIADDLDEALVKANAEDRKSIEKLIAYLDKINRAHYLDQLGQERIIRTAAKIREEHPDTTADLGFKHYTLYEPSKETLDKLESFSPGEQMFSNLLDEFGVPTVLTTWLVRDGYGFTAKYETLDFAGYEAYFCGKHLYLINEGLSDEAITAICEKLESDANFNPENIILFGYSFTWGMRDTLQINVKRLKDTEKNLRVNFDVRY